MHAGRSFGGSVAYVLVNRRNADDTQHMCAVPHVIFLGMDSIQPRDPPALAETSWPRKMQPRSEQVSGASALKRERKRCSDDSTDIFSPVPSLSKLAMAALNDRMKTFALPHRLEFDEYLHNPLEKSMAVIIHSGRLSLRITGVQNIWINFVNLVGSGAEVYRSNDVDKILYSMKERAGIEDKSTLSECAEAFYDVAGKMVQLLLEKPVFPSVEKGRQVLFKLDSLVKEVSLLLGKKHAEMYSAWDAQYRPAISKAVEGLVHQRIEFR